MGVIGAITFLLVSTFTGFCQVAPKLPRHETLIVESLTGRLAAPKRFNAWVPPANISHGYHQLSLRSLWYIDPHTGDWTNALAEEPPIYNDDFTKMTVKLRKEIYWSDDVEFTADDLVFTVETIKNNPGMEYSSWFDICVDKIYKTDDYTVVFEFKKPNSRFHSSFLVRYAAGYIMPKHIWEKVEDPMTFNFYPPVSLGPYVLKDVDSAGYWTLWERRKDWDRTVMGKLHGMPKPRYVLFVYLGPPEKCVMAQARHDLDVIFMITPQAWEVLREKNPYSRCWYKDFPWAYLQDPCVPGVTINNDRYPLNIKDVRWALTLAIDIVDALMIAYDGCVRMTALPLTPTEQYFKYYYEPMENWLRNLTLDVDGESFKPYDTTTPFRLADRCEKKGYSVPTDPEKIKKVWGFGWWKHVPEVAEKLLRKHGLKRDKNGKWLLPDGTPWKITILTQGPVQPTITRLGFAVAEQWRKFGIDAKIETNELLWTIANSGDYDCAMTWPVETWGGHPDLFRFLEYWHSDYYVPIGKPANSRNPTRWKDKRMDRIIEKTKATDFDDPKTIELGIEAIKLMVEGMPLIPMVGYNMFSPLDEYYWTNFPTEDNPYMLCESNWANYGFILPYLKPTGRK